MYVNSPLSIHKHSLLTCKWCYTHGWSLQSILSSVHNLVQTSFNVVIFDNFAPQSFKVFVELKELKKLQQQIICSQGGQPLLGLVQNLASHSLNSQVKKVFACESFHGLAWYVVFISVSQCRYCEIAKRRPFVDRRALAWLMACGCRFCSGMRDFKN